MRESSRRKSKGRGVVSLLADAGHEVPRQVAEPKAPKDKMNWGHAPARGRMRPGGGWSPVAMPNQRWRMPSDQTPALWPLISTPGLPPTGAFAGIDQLSGGFFPFDPFGWVLDDKINVTNPNVYIMAKPGRGKSTLTKSLSLRMMRFGYKTLCLGDVKDEYEGLCRALGVEPLVLGRGMPARINPLDLGPLGDGWEDLDPDEAKRRASIIFARWLSLLRGLVSSQDTGRGKVPYGPSEESIVRGALKELTGFSSGASRLRVTTLPELWYQMCHPTPEMIKEARFSDEQSYLDESRLVRDAIATLVQDGALSGLFDAHTNVAIDWSAPIQSLSLSRIRSDGDEAVGLALTCLNSWGRGLREVSREGDLRIVIRDEVWAQMRLGPGAVKSLDEDLRLSRTQGEIPITVMHKPSDGLAVGDAGSMEVQIAKDFMHLADVKILMGQDLGVAEEIDRMLGLGPSITGHLHRWCMQGKGRAIWSVGDQFFKIEPVLHPLEAQLTDTNQAIRRAG